MFESQFGFTAPPFLLSPDPAFYFESKGHARALAYLKFGIHQGEGFIVVTGDVGSGKTTLVRTLLGALPPNRVFAVEVSSTQVDDYGLLHAICIGSGMDVPTGASKAQLQGMIHRLAVHVSTQGRRTLLLVDEAQNLGPREIEELRMLSNYHLANRALLQSYLIGQTELRDKLRVPELEPFRQRVIASCHLGPLDRGDIRGYIEHRLKRVGWSDRPRFEDSAFAAVHQHTSGIPRRINLLMTRALLDAALNGHRVIGGDQIHALAAELLDESGLPRPPA